MTEEILIKKLKTLITVRVFFVVVLLGSFFVFRIGYKIFPYPSSVLYLAVILFALTIVYAFLLGKVKSLPFAYLQIGLDIVAAIALISFTGGIESWFSSLMLLIVIAAAIVVNKKAGYFAAILSSILYGLLIDLQFYGILPIPYDPMLLEKDFLYNIFSHITALYLTAYLTGQLSSRLERKDIDLRDLTLFNKEVIENTPSGLFTTDLKGNILLFNKAAESITGIDRNTAIGKPISDIFPFIGQLQARKRLEETVEFDGKEKVIGLTLSRMQDAKGKHIGFIGIFQDLTELKKMAQEIKHKEKWATIGELSANIAHEIRNPLASLKSSIEMLKENTLTPEQKSKLMSIALSEMDRLNGIITDFLNYSRPPKLKVQSFDLHQTLNKTLDLLKNRNAANVSIQKNFSGSLFIKADREKLEQVFWNLGVNALDAMPSGGELTVTTNQKNGLVEIIFKDTGIGIAPEAIDKVFYPFFTTKKNGTGLGLSIAYRIVEDHNGTMKVISAPGKGAQFDILIPREYEKTEG
jgi:two-component system sensor histidine kinase PilS (NtrC family)